MIIQTLTYNGLDIAPMCERNSLIVRPIRKAGRSWTDLNQNEHGTTVGFSYEVQVTLNPLTYAQAQALYAEIASGPHSLVFQYAGLANPITQSSIVDGLPLQPTFSARLVKAETEIIFKEQYYETRRKIHG